ncbi:LysR family transcriptional regulator [Oceanicoccus sagamiensis]|uniref:LysR family transcriptional regulator n=1 Tax=Oceanicoccus sagamiensis TaxID=716816 RepID=A0A1X9NFH0_9GAMM|nr:LysR family transcriptional regulator [Oceanicoccus sagamiensis]
MLGQLSDTDIRLLRVFKTVAECGGFSAAELELNINRSTISRHIKDLELRLGVTLCQRGRGGFSLTPEGRHIYDAGLRMLASIDEFRAEVDDVHRRLTGTLSLAIFDKTVTNPNAFVDKSLRLFDDMAPDVDIEIYVEPINEIERAVMDGRFHIGIIPGHRTSTSLDYIPLYDEQMYLYCGKQHALFQEKTSAISKKKIQACKYAGLGYHSPNMEIGRQLEMQRKATAYDQEAIAHLILSGRYVGYLPDHYAKSFIEQGLMRAIGEKTFQYRCQFNAIIRHAPKPSRVTQTFLQALIKSHSHN